MKKLYPLLFLFLLFTSVSLNGQTTLVDEPADNTPAGWTLTGITQSGGYWLLDDMTDKVTSPALGADGCTGLSAVLNLRSFGSGSVFPTATVTATCGALVETMDFTNLPNSYIDYTFTLPSTFDNCPSLVIEIEWTDGTRRLRVNNVIVESTSGTCSGILLPVELTKFNATKRADKVNLAWQTATEINNDRFEIQRSYDGNRFESIGKVYGEGNSQKLVDYSFVDDAPLSGVNYYRLKQVDIDGAFEYSDIASVKMDKAANIRITPTSTLDYVTVNTGEASSIMVRSINGQVMNSQTDAEGNFTVDMANYPQGIYYLTIQISGTVQTEKVVRL